VTAPRFLIDENLPPALAEPAREPARIVIAY